MAAKFIHFGIPVTDVKPGMTFIEPLKLWLSNPDDSEFKFEYLKFEDGNPFHKAIKVNVHAGYEIDDTQAYIEKADEVLQGPSETPDGRIVTFVKIDEAILELVEYKNK